MLTLPEILEWLNEAPDRFMRHYHAGEYGKAAYDHESAINTMNHIELDAEPRERIMSRFDEEKVKEVYKEARHAK